MFKTDSQIQQEVLHELEWDTHIGETDIGVAVEAGVVILSGTVRSWAERAAAERAAHAVAGVLDVANDIQVKIPGSPGVTDTEIAHAIRLTLEWDVRVPDERIRSTVSDGQVTLDGDVDCLSQRDDAEKAVRNVKGVGRVINRIEVKPVGVATKDVRAAVAAALERRAQREANHVKLDVQDGRVTLSGSVYSLAERQAAVGAARGTHGVRSVHDQLRVVPHAS